MLRVVCWGTGDVGHYALRGVLGHPDLELVGVRVWHEDKAGRDVGALVGWPETCVRTTTSTEEILALRPDCLIHMAPSRVGEPVRLILDSIDVNHAFYVPQFLIKRDLIPVGENGTPNELEFTVTEEGTYAGQCAEFCGGAHADMTFTVTAMERATYDGTIAAIAAGEPPPAPGDDECATTIQVAAVESIQFDTDLIEAPAGEDFCIEFTNNDTVPHDIGIVETEFNGDDVDAGETITYLIPAMEAGDYTFICTLHPQAMVGDLVVGE